MADAAGAAARRREARRRRILMNSEERMKKVIGLSKSKQDDEREDQELPSSSEKFELSSGTENPGLSLVTEKISETIDNRLLEDITHNATQVGKTSKLSVKETNLDLEEQGETEVTTSKGNQDTELQGAPEEMVTAENQENETLQTDSFRNSDQLDGNESEKTNDDDKNVSESVREEELSETEPAVARTFEPLVLPRMAQQSINETSTTILINEKQRLLFVICFAMIVRVLVTWSVYVWIFSKSILIPFFTMEAIIVYHQRSSQVQQGQQSQSMLVLALMLCGVPQDTLTDVSKTMKIFTAVLTDFSVYIFSFVVFHSILEIFV
ncbi:guided entry of tail-anchored proteins factor CAMLG-like [Ptychodera flava]|uniref:guided entry of tail-anchored proteins factor CAMLG-like n=1 Tax=Ptychodera flava TaxID=63121 RepID=UPI00396A9E8C